jgi:uncharacterized protein
MNLSNSFRIDAPIGDVWEVLGDFGTVARCMPGAQLHEVRGDELLGSVTVRLGPMKAQYDGVARVMEQDASAFRMVIQGSGRNKRGGGTAKATMVASLAQDAGECVVSVQTELAITGRPAQMGQGLLQDVAEQIVNQFAERLQAELSSSPEATESVPPPSEDALDLGTAVSGPLMARVGPLLLAGSVALVVVWWLFQRG